MKSFEEHEALEVGVDGAVILFHIDKMISSKVTSGAKGPEATWVKGSAADIQIDHPYWSAKKVQRILRSLVDSGHLLSKKGRDPFDQTRLYSTKTYQCTK